MIEIHFLVTISSYLFLLLLFISYNFSEVMHYHKPFFIEFKIYHSATLPASYSKLSAISSSFMSFEKVICFSNNKMENWLLFFYLK